MANHPKSIEERERQFWNCVDLEREGEMNADFSSYGDYMKQQKLIWRKIHGLAYHLCGENLEGKDALDVGCGSGTATWVLAQRGSKVVSLDLSENMVNLALRKAEKAGLSKNVEGFVGNISDLHKTEKKFDLIFAGAVCHHLTHFNEEIQMMEKMLKPNGIFVAYDPVASPFFDFARNYLPYQQKRRSKDERPLKKHHYSFMKSVFASIILHRFEPFTSVERIAMTDSEHLWKIFEYLDRVYFSVFSDFLCWHVVVVARKSV